MEEPFRMQGASTCKIRFTLSMPKAVHQQIVSISRQYGLAMNALINQCILYAIENLEQRD